MSTAADVLHELDVIGATIVPAGDRLLVRAGSKPVPAGVIRRVREAKPELLALLYQQNTALALAPGLAPLAEGEPAWSNRALPAAGVCKSYRTTAHFCISVVGVAASPRSAMAPA